ncbi:MAG: NfeD family protein [Alphaproteobacteria bacterium]|nr:NfeD family protein [Alphaproteobacteria bacterium]
MDFLTEIEALVTHPAWWHWVVIGVGFLLAELIVPAFVLFWFGLGSFLVMVAVLVMPALPLAAQLSIWGLSSLLMLFLWFRVFKRDAHKSLVGRASAALEGEEGLIVERVAPFKAGKVRFSRPIVGSDIWTCMADQEIEIGARVRVERIEGNNVFVKKTGDKS